MAALPVQLKVSGCKPLKVHPSIETGNVAVHDHSTNVNELPSLLSHQLCSARLLPGIHQPWGRGRNASAFLHAGIKPDHLWFHDPHSCHPSVLVSACACYEGK